MEIEAIVWPISFTPPFYPHRKSLAQKYCTNKSLWEAEWHESSSSAWENGRLAVTDRGTDLQQECKMENKEMFRGTSENLWFLEVLQEAMTWKEDNFTASTSICYLVCLSHVYFYYVAQPCNAWPCIKIVLSILSFEHILLYHINHSSAVLYI